MSSSDLFEFYRREGGTIEQSLVGRLKDHLHEKFGSENGIEVKNDGTTIFLGLELVEQGQRDSIVATVLSDLQSIGIELRDVKQDGGEDMLTHIEQAIDQTQTEIPAPAVTASI